MINGLPPRRKRWYCSSSFSFGLVCLDVRGDTGASLQSEAPIHSWANQFPLFLPLVSIDLHRKLSQMSLWVHQQHSIRFFGFPPSNKLRPIAISTRLASFQTADVSSTWPPKNELRVSAVSSFSQRPALGVICQRFLQKSKCWELLKSARGRRAVHSKWNGKSKRRCWRDDGASRGVWRTAVGRPAECPHQIFTTIKRRWHTPPHRMFNLFNQV